MSGLKAPSSAERMPEQSLDKGQGFLRAIGEKLGQMPALRDAIKAGAMLSLLGGAASLPGCDIENGNSPAIGSEKTGQGYGKIEAALTTDEMKALSTPVKVAGTEVGDGSPEFGEIDGKKVIFIVRKNAQGAKSVYFKSGNSLKELTTQGAFTEIQGLGDANFTSKISLYKNTAYLQMQSKTFGSSLARADIQFDANDILELSNITEMTDIYGDDIKVVEINGTPYLYVTDAGSWKNKRKELTPDLAAPVEDLGLANFNGTLPAYHNGMWIGNRMVNSGGQNVSKAYWSSTFQGVATSSTAVSKLNVGLWANTGDLAVAEDDERVVVVESKWNTGYPTSVVFSEFVKPPVVNPDPSPDAGSNDVDAGPTDTDATDAAEDVETELPPAEDVIIPPVDAEPELPPPEDIIVPPVDTAETAEDAAGELPQPDTTDAGQPQPDVAEDAEPELPPPEDIIVPPVDTAETAEDAAEELPKSDVVDGELPPAEDVIVPPVDTAETAEDAAEELPKSDIVDGELPPPDAQSEVTPADIAADIAAEIQEDANADLQADAADALEIAQDAFETAQDLGMTELPKEDVAVQPDAPESADGSQNSDGLSKPDSSQKPDVGSNPPVAKDGCSAGPRKSPWGANALAAYILAAVIAVYSRRRTVQKL